MTERGFVRDVTDWPVGDDPEDMGTRTKEWLVEPGTDPEVPWLFKGVRCKELHDGTIRCFEEDWAEALATQAASLFGAPAAHVGLATRNPQSTVGPG